ncbi:hypothetical protein KCU63_g45, partial [Aureobasidium melanogenum]
MGSSTAVCQPHRFLSSLQGIHSHPTYALVGKISVRNHVQIQMHAAFAIAKSRRYCKPLYHVRVRQMVDKYPCHGASQFCRSCFKQPQFLDLIDSDLPKFNLYSNYRRRDRSGKGH